MMTTSRQAAAVRRRLVGLSVLAGSSLVLAASWVGVVRFDLDAAPGPTQVAAAPSTLGPGVSSNAEPTQLVPAPQPRRVVVVRESRAS